LPRDLRQQDSSAAWTSFISPDGHAVRFIISHNRIRSADGINRIDAIKSAAFEAIKGTPLRDQGCTVGGTASTFKDIRRATRTPLHRSIAALTLIFITSSAHHAQSVAAAGHRRTVGAGR